MSSKRGKRRSACGDKVRYDQEGAFAAAKALHKRFPAERISAYPCPFCGHWHIGHTPHKVRQAIKSRRGK